jgi:gliding motility-associated transport system ATP-binding protein
MQIKDGVSQAKYVVEVKDLAKSYGEVRALRGVSFSIPTGSVVGFLGPNGAGKTTAIKILTGYLAADSGTASVCGQNVESCGLEARSLVGYLPENNPLYSDMRVIQFLRFAWRAQQTGSQSESMAEALDRVVQRTGLQSVFHKTISSCSKGFRQRVGLAQALLHDPPLLILDEPTNGLDPLQVVEIRQLIRELGRTKTVLLTSHVLSEVESLADRVVLIHQGSKVADGSLQELAGAQGGATIRLVVRAPRAQLEAALALAAAETTGDTAADMAPDTAADSGKGPDLQVLQWLQTPYGDPQCCGVQLQVPAINSATLERISRRLHQANLPILEIAPQSDSLEALFRNLQRGEA